MSARTEGTGDAVEGLLRQAPLSPPPGYDYSAWPVTLPAISRDREGAAPQLSAAWCAWQIACSLAAYKDPKPGQLSGRERDQVARALGARWAGKVAGGESSNAWHELHEWALAAYPLAACEVCGGPTRHKEGGLHELCRLRAMRGVATPRVDSTPECGCYSCRKGAR